MKLSAKTEYGCLAMLHLAAQYALGEPVQIRKVAAEHDIPWRFLVQILLELKRAGLVTSTRGAAGGYRLARPPAEIQLAEVIDILEGTASKAVANDAVPGLRGALVAACAAAYAAYRRQLASVTLSDLVETAGSDREPMWYI